MSTTLLNVSAGSTAGLSDGFRVALTEGGPTGISIRATAPAGDLENYDSKIQLVIVGSNFDDGPTAEADISAQFEGAGAVTVPIEASSVANAVRYTETAVVLSGPNVYGYLVTQTALSDDLTIEIEALEL